jgi:signal transduction histidine kinase
VTALGKLFRTTVFKLSIIYLLVFALGSGLVIGWMAWSIRRLVDEQITVAIDAEIKGLSEQYAQGGIRRLVFVVEARTRRPGASLYLVTNFQGLPIAGNVTELPAGTLERAGLIETAYQRPDSQTPDRVALARIFQLPGGFRLLVGRDVEERETLSNIISRALMISLLWLVAIGTLGGLFVARRVLRRVDAMNDATQTIMQGNVNGRLPVTGTNDELDRLAVSLNLMLERIGELMAGLKQVSDNIAHDLRTPLNRLRGRAEEALRSASSPDDYRTALEKVIEESDQLIRIFNALLLIARAEAGNATDAMADFDVSQIARDVAELYEPAAEEAGLRLVCSDDHELNILGNRELLGQAVANLVDNAIKYGKPPPVSGQESSEQTPDMGADVVRIKTRRNGANAEIIVEDHGVGIQEGDRSRVIERFVRLEGSRTRAGSGLGLSLAAAVARLHGGELRLEDNAPGLRVVFSLPATPVSENKRQGRDGRPATGNAGEIARPETETADTSTR